MDKECAKYVFIYANHENIEEPKNFVTNGQIILNIAPRAVTNFKMNNEYIKLSTRFGGIPIDIFCPMGSILGIYAQENGQGMMFEPDPDDEPPPQGQTPKNLSSLSKTKPRDTVKGKPSLRVIK